MPAKHLLIPQNVQKRVAKLPQRIRTRFNDALLRLKQNPLIGIKLQGELAGLYKLRLGDYRVVYRFQATKKAVDKKTLI